MYFKNYDIKVSKYVIRDKSRLFLLLLYKRKHKDFDTRDIYRGKYLYFKVVTEF